MNKMIALLGSSALLAALLAGGYAYAQSGFVVAPIRASLERQGDGQCRGHVAYAIALDDAEIADDVGVSSGALEIRAACARLDALVSGETYDTKAGKLDISMRGARVYVLPSDPDGSGPRVAGECDLEITARVRPADALLARVFRPRTISRIRPAPQCAPLTNLISNSCVVARGSWPDDVPLPAIPACGG